MADTDPPVPGPPGVPAPTTFLPISQSQPMGIWTLSYDGMADFAVEQVLEPLPAGDFTVITQVVTLPTGDPKAGIGLVLMGDEEPMVYLLASTGEVVTEAPFAQTTHAATMPWLKIEVIGTIATCFHSLDGSDWTQVAGGPLETRPGRAGLVLRYSDAHIPVWGQAAAFRVLEGILGPPVMVGVQTAMAPPVPSLMMMTSQEPIVHVLIGAQFGDLEYDVGKSVRWAMYFTDRHFVLDVNLGTQRYYVVNWSLTYPEAQHGTTSINFFYRPVEFRKELFARGDKAWHYNDEDWILFCDAHEGLSCNTSSLPNDYAVEPFKSYLYREVTRAEEADQDQVSVPFFAFVKHDDIDNVSYGIGDDETGTFVATQPIAVPYYIPADGLVRLIRVSALRDPDFDWQLLDQPSSVDPGCKIQIVSYGYAHWNLQDIVPRPPSPAPISAENDDGWEDAAAVVSDTAHRGLPYTDPWKDPSQDDQGLRGPTAVEVSDAPITMIWLGSIATIGVKAIGGPFGQQGGTWMSGPGADIGVRGLSGVWTKAFPEFPGLRSTLDPAVGAIHTPLYDTVFRINLRDGVWYEGDVLGNIPMVWNEVNQNWEAAFDPDLWKAENFVEYPL